MADTQPVDQPRPGADRLTSLDALRGFDMFWIIGGEQMAHAAAKLTGWAWLVWLAGQPGQPGQLEHPEWDGFAFYDLIFPLFLFLAGVAMPFSFDKRTARGDTKAQLARHVIVRGLVLVLLGMIYNGLLKFDWPNTRLPSVLGRIGLAYLFAGLIVLNTRPRGQFLAAIALLIAYWAALKFIPVPGFGPGDLSPGHTLTDWIDRTLIPGRLYQGDRDPEGLLATVPAIATCLAGVLTGHLLKSTRFGGHVKTLFMIVAGAVCLALAWLWNHEFLNTSNWWRFPLNKNLWSSSFVLYCASWSLLFLALFYLIIDVWRLRRWSILFTVIGANSIFIYMASGGIIDFAHTTHFFFDGLLKRTGAYQPLLFATAIVFIQWLLLYYMYKKRIFLRV